MKYSEILATFGIVAMLSASMIGCGPGISTGEVKGSVTYNGEPVKQGTIMFQPKNSTPGYGKIVDGQIVDVMVDGVKGAPVGEVKVGIQAVEAGADMYAPTKSLVPDNYADPEKSGLTAKIESGKTTELKLELK